MKFFFCFLSPLQWLWGNGFADFFWNATIKIISEPLRVETLNNSVSLVLVIVFSFGLSNDLDGSSSLNGLWGWVEINSKVAFTFSRDISPSFSINHMYYDNVGSRYTNNCTDANIWYMSTNLFLQIHTENSDLCCVLWNVSEV